ncbi:MULTISPECIES: PLP-dependent aminotransferase family protein [unclassified Pseudomonas]|uniref:aminotransferase-like domain-containing protein n=1 Tax=unclassified Pseudomonas TaxID=196821 RepID=UPI000D82BB3C|nr:MULTISPECIES: PLP-dependent aminotransferase family protein [unclassified Pseudomonas]PYG78414.1 DNA-binding transcriptional MocR family regulator [Pseudomonas sp. RV120224-01c]PYG82645.1 DNA-binding transcriptional MocR family regulator [Pseudomonas sp. RV120224-01b]
MSSRGFVPLYKQLADEIAEAISTGRLPVGTSMPSLRDCASHNRLSMNTVVAAYRLLEDQGLIASRPQSGFEVSGVLPELDCPLEPQVTPVSADSESDLLSQMLKAHQRPSSIDLAFASPRGKRFFPSEALAKLTRTVLQNQRYLVASYVLPPGSQLLRYEIVRRSVRLGMSFEAENICLTHGTTEALQLALRVVARPGDAIGIEAPSYFNLYPLLHSLGLKGIEIPTHPRTGFVMADVEALLADKTLAAIVCMPTVQNPLGYTMPIEHKRRLAELAAFHQVPVIEDSIYAELQFTEPLQPTLKSFDKDGWVLVCGGFSKTLAPDYRVGWLEAGRFTKSVQRLKFCSSASESMILCETIGLFLKNGGYERHLKTLRRLYQVQIGSVRSLISRHFPAGTRATQPQGGFVLWIELPESVDSMLLAQDALSHDIVIMPGHLYSKGERFQNCIRLTCCQEVDDRFTGAVAKLGELACNLAKRSSTSTVPSLRSVN